VPVGNRPRKIAAMLIAAGPLSRLQNCGADFPTSRRSYMSGVMPVKDWATALQEFEQLAGVKKPRERFNKIMIMGFVDLGKNIEQLVKPGVPANQFKQLLDKYKNTAAHYIKELDEIIAEEDEKTQFEWIVNNRQVDVKKFKTDLLRGSKMLKAKLANYASQFDMTYTFLSQQGSKLSKIQKLEENFVVMLKNGFKRFKNAEKTIKAMPTVEIWNREMGQDGIRTLTTALATYRAIQKELELTKTELSDAQKQMNAKAMEWKVKLDPWSDGAKKKLTGNFSKDAITNELKAVSTIVKQCGQNLGAILKVDLTG
jgi:hypothetical protein